MSEDEQKINVGGQAVIEGVMMRSPQRVAVAVRRADGKIVVKDQDFQSIMKRFKILGWPILRGAVVLIESLILGIRALNFSSEIAINEEKPGEKVNKKSKKSDITIGFTMVLAFSVGLLLFFYIPLLLTDLTGVKSGLGFNLIDGFFRMLIFLGYIILISRWKEIRRVFEYHGAEHKSVFAFEDKRELSIQETQPYSTHHPRCGTSFLFMVIIVSIIVFIFLGRPDSIPERLLRLAFVPIIGGISYELIRLSDKVQKNNLLHIFILPGLWLQRITTKEPDTDQLEVALVALKTALGQNVSGYPSEIIMEGPLKTNQ